MRYLLEFVGILKNLSRFRSNLSPAGYLLLESSVAQTSQGNETNMDDAELVQQVLRGNRGAYQHLIERFTAQIRALCRANVWRQDAVDDLVQETFYRGLQNLRNLQKADRFGFWLYGIARNLCNDWNKDPHHRTAAMVDRPAPAEDNQLERISDLMEAVRRLPPELRETLMLYYASAVTYAQLAEKLDISVPLVNKRLTEARKLLREWLGGNPNQGTL
jgi:RNA polymerase sigma factor (sigma-70 family)